MAGPRAARSGKLRLGVFLSGAGHHNASWRLPEAPVHPGIDLRYFQNCVEIAERGLFDMAFLADFGAVRESDVGLTTSAAYFEPVTLLSALAVSTKRVGLIATATSTYNEPYNMARRFASLDLLSEGRAGWNLVTSSVIEEAYNFGYEQHPDQSYRYARAREFAEVVCGLWDSWEPGALISDKESGRYHDPKKLHRLSHKDKFFSVRGPLTVPPSAQGRPIIVQSGSSDDGIALAAETADVVFTAQENLADAKVFYAKLKQKLASFGRKSGDLKIMPGLAFVLGRTEEEARAKYEECQSKLDTKVALGRLSSTLGDIDLTKYPLDQPLPDIDVSHIRGSRSRAQLLINKGKRENLSIIELARFYVGARGHHLVVGTGIQLADVLEEWFTSEGADGFNLMPWVLPDGLSQFVEYVVPELQKRGLFRRAYEGVTLRENLGLPAWVNRYSARATARSTHIA